jgi:hypothetical protein
MGIHAHATVVRGKGGHGGSPNVEAGKMYQHLESSRYIITVFQEAETTGVVIDYRL